MTEVELCPECNKRPATKNTDHHMCHTCRKRLVWYPARAAKERQAARERYAAGSTTRRSEDPEARERRMEYQRQHKRAQYNREKAEREAAGPQFFQPFDDDDGR